MDDEISPDLGTEVWLYRPDNDPTDDDFENLTAVVGPGFGDPLTKYTWSAEVADLDGPGGDAPMLYVGTFSTQNDILGLLGFGLWGNAAIQTGAFPLSVLAGNLGLTEPTPELIEVLLFDTFNTIDSDGGEILRYDFETQVWTTVLDASSPLIDDETIGVRDLVSYNNSLYASTTNNLIYSLFDGGETPAKVLVSDTGDPGSFVELTGGPSNAPGTESIRAMTVVTVDDGDSGTKEVLYVGTENIEFGAQVWAYDDSEEEPWTLIQTFDGDDYASAVSEIEQIGGEIVVGTWLPYKVYILDGDSAIVDVTPAPELNTGEDPGQNSAENPVFGTNGQPQNDEVNDNGVMQIREYDGYTYVGSVNYASGASLYRIKNEFLGTDNTKWETITTDGFRDVPDLAPYYAPDSNDATYVWQLAVVWDPIAEKEVLYFGDFNGTGSGQATFGQITHADDGNNTAQLSLVPSTADPFRFDEGPAYGIRKLEGIQLDPDTGLPTEDQSQPNAVIIGTADVFQTRPNGNNILADYDNGLSSIPPIIPIPSTITGTPLEDILIGGSSSDQMFGGEEDDLLFGDFNVLGFGPNGAADTISGQEGEDLIFSTQGDDSVRGGAGEDIIMGSGGRDWIAGNANNDVIIGDDFRSGVLADIIEALIDGSVDDLLSGLTDGVELPFGISAAQIVDALSEDVDDENAAVGNLNDTLEGQDGNDVIIGGLGFDYMVGGRGADVMYGDSSTDFVFGQTGDDIVDGGSGSDLMSGGEGDDVIITGLGNDNIYGNDGEDRFIVRGGDPEEGAAVETGNDIIRDFEQGSDKIDLSEFFQNPIRDFLSPIPNFGGFNLVFLGAGGSGIVPSDIFDFDVQVGGAIEYVDGDTVIDLSKIDGGFSDAADLSGLFLTGGDSPVPLTDPQPTGTGTITIRNVELVEDDFIVDTQFIDPTGLVDAFFGL